MCLVWQVKSILSFWRSKRRIFIRVQMPQLSKCSGRAEACPKTPLHSGALDSKSIKKHQIKTILGHSTIYKPSLTVEQKDCVKHKSFIEPCSSWNSYWECQHQGCRYPPFLNPHPAAEAVGVKKKLRAEKVPSPPITFPMVRS